MPALTDGEAWVRAELGELRARRFSPPAVATFLRRSQRRAGEVRAARPALARQSRSWLAGGAAAYVVARAPLRLALPWWGAVALMLDWHLGMVETEDGEPRGLGPADALTLARVWLVPLAYADPRPVHAAVALATDGLDGAVARRTATTRAGRDLEGLADACFAAAALAGARRHDRIGRAAVAAELARLGAGVAYAVLVWFATPGRPDPRVTAAARITTPVRAAGLAAAASGRRRTATALVLGGCAWSLAAVAQAAGRGGARFTGSAQDGVTITCYGHASRIVR